MRRSALRADSPAVLGLAGRQAGLLVVQKDSAAFSLTKALSVQGRPVLRLTRIHDTGRQTVSETVVRGRGVTLRVVGRDLDYRFQASTDGRRWTNIGPVLDGRELSPAVLKGFNYTGVFVGLYGSANGHPTTAHADFKRFRYEGNEPAR